MSGSFLLHYFVAGRYSPQELNKLIKKLNNSSITLDSFSGNKRYVNESEDSDNPSTCWVFTEFKEKML